MKFYSSNSENVLFILNKSIYFNRYKNGSSSEAIKINKKCEIFSDQNTKLTLNHDLWDGTITV